MLRKVIDSKLPVLVYNPTGIFSKEYFREAQGAGTLPVFDTEFLSNDEIKKNIDELENSKILFGIRVNVKNNEILDLVKNSFYKYLNAIIIFYDEETDLNILKDYSTLKYKIIIEALSILPNVFLEEIEPEAIIVKGNEASGRVSQFSTFVLMQWYVEQDQYPVFVHGGVGFYTAPGYFAAGVSGIVLDAQLYLTDESPISAKYKEALNKFDEKSSVKVGTSLRRRYSFFTKLATKITKDAKVKESELINSDDADAKFYEFVRENITFMNDESKDPVQSLIFLGQDAIFAKQFVNKSAKLKDVISNLMESISNSLNDAEEFDQIKADSPVAKEHGTKYPVMQGPMANISDKADFAKAIYEGGGLPFMAMGSLPDHLSDPMLTETAEKAKKWGMGLIGFSGINKMIDNHIAQAKKYKPPFALFAGGVPGQVKELEAEGIKTYLHVPAPSILENGVANGVTRFIFEGHEAGGHVGALTSTVLWECNIKKIVENFPDKIKDLRLIFAGGIGSTAGTNFVTGMSSSLSKEGAKIGLQVGTAYLFTDDIVKHEAINETYQQLICSAENTIVTGETIGLSTRTLGTNFARKMIEREHERVRSGMPLQERKHEYELDNFGALLIGAKGFCPEFQDDGTVNLKHFDDEDQVKSGNYMCGEALIFNECKVSIDSVHQRLFENKKVLRENLNAIEIFTSEDNELNDEVAIIGMGCVYPGANNPMEYWKNIIEKNYQIKDFDKFDFDKYYFNTDRKAEDKSYTKAAACIDQFEFDHKKFNYTKEQAEEMSPSQKSILESAFQAVASSGYYFKDKNKAYPKSRTSVIIGSCLSNPLTDALIIKHYYPELKHHLETQDEFKNLSDDEKEKILTNLRETLKDGRQPKYPIGAAINIESSLISAHLGLEGVNYTVDAACATSFTALDNAVKELLGNVSDVSIVGGVNTNLSPETFIGFGKMGALSAEGSFPFDKRAGGFVLGGGAGALIIKRMKDAVRDGDNIMAVIKGIGGSTDGKGKAIAAPQLRGQYLAIQRCYDNCKDKNFTKDKIDFIEAHGTSTLMGDKTEIETIKEFYGSLDTKIGVSSAKAIIGHLLGGAGAAGLIKTVLSLQNKTLPPNGLYEELSPKFDIEGSSLYIVKDPTEWKKDDNDTRKAVVSSYGFGGINYHIGVEEFTKNYKFLERKIGFNNSFNSDDDKIVIAGIGVVAPGSLNSEDYWKTILDGSPQFSEIPEERFHIKNYHDQDKEYNLPDIKAGIIKDFKFNNIKFRIPPTTTKSLDRNQLLILEIADEAVKNSGIADILKEKDNRVGIIFGTTTGETHNDNLMRVRNPWLEDIIKSTEGVDEDKKNAVADKFIESIKKRYFKNTEDTIPGLLNNIVAGRVANFFNCNGPSYIIEAECASSAVALNAALIELKSKRSDVVLCGGVDSNLSPSTLMAYNLIKVLANGEGKFFDKNSTGLVMGEGGAILVLTTLKYAKEKNLPIMAEVADVDFQSYASENMLSPTTSSFGRVMNRFYKKSAMSRNKIDYIDVFASSNKLVDKWELEALEGNYHRKLYFGNSKSQIGYMRAANPSLVFSKLALMTKNNTIVPNKTYNPETTMINDDMSLTGNTEPVQLNPNEENYFAANFGGLGGNTGHVVIKTVPKRLIESGEVSSAPSQEFYKATGTESFSASAGNNKYALLFSGQGAQYPGMMKGLYDANPTIKSLFDKGESIFKSERGYSLLDLMFGNDAENLNLTENTQPAVFMSSAAIYSYLKDNGLSSSSMIGHSLGEITALFAADVLTFDDALKLVIKRSSLMKTAAESEKGSIMVVFKGADETAATIKSSSIDSVYLANKNSDSQTAVSGKADSITQYCKYLDGQKIRYTKLKLSGAFHSPLFNKASEEFRKYLDTISFNVSGIDKVVSNVTAKRYVKDEKSAKDNLAKQIISSVEFVESVKYLSSNNPEAFIEIGPNNILIKLHAKISGAAGEGISTVIPKKDPVEALNSVLDKIKPAVTQTAPVKLAGAASTTAIKDVKLNIDSDNPEYKKFLEEKSADIEKILYEEFIKERKEAAFRAIEQRGIFTGSIVVAGVSVGLPGKSSRVFNDDNFQRILNGQNFIDTLSKEEQLKMVDQNITRVFKDPNGNAKFVEIKDLDHIIHLAAQLGYFDLSEYGVEYDYDINYGLAIAAGIEALKDANIPLVQSFKKTSQGTMLPNGYLLPEELQEDTGVIFTSLFPGFETLIDEITKYYADRFARKPFDEFEKIYFYLMEKVKDDEVKKGVTDWYMKAKQDNKIEKYNFNRSLLTQIISLGSSHFAQMIKAKGPNTMVSGACASATQAVAVAEDWIRMGRCDRVVIVGGEAATSEIQNQWIGSGFLALGAASVKQNVSEAVKPFDEDRNGMVVGSGAFGMIVEKQDLLAERGLNGQAEIIGTYIGNSAFHVSRIDVQHLSYEMKKFFDKMEVIYGKNRSEFAKDMVFMSHETYTPARGGSAEAEVQALKNAFPQNYTNITITNVKGFTGHTLGAGIEDVVLVKGLQHGIVPPIPNLKKIPPHFKDLKFSTGQKADYKYGFHMAAGFGSHFAFLFIKKLDEVSIQNNPKYIEWLRKISGTQTPELFEYKKALCVKIDPNKHSHPVVKETTASPAPVEAPVVAAPAVTVDINKIKSTIAGQTGYDIEMLEEDLDLEADLGIDTVKQVEIFGEVAAQFGLAVPEDLQLSELNTIRKLTDYISANVGGGAAPASPVTASAPAASVDINVIKATIAEQTGYDSEMLEEDLDLEADLGIDTVKQVEIFGEVASQYGLAVPEDLQLSELNTIRKLTDYISANVSGGAAPAAASAASVDVNVIKATIADQTGYDAEMLEEDLDLEADLGIDTVKQVEIFGEVAAQFGLAVPEDLQLSELNTIRKLTDYISANVSGGVAPAAAAPAASSAAGASVDINKIKSTIAEQTGYETSMLDENLDLEADLGIDTVKQVEIFGEVASQYGLAVPEDLQLSELNTIKKLAEYISANVSGGAAPAAAAPVASSTGAAVDINKIKATIAEQTGYETSMLDENLDLEADLGIDTVKQVEIFGEVASGFGLSVPEDLQLSELNTIKKLADYVSANIGGSAAPVAEVAPAMSKAVESKAPKAESASTKDVKRLTLFVEEKSIELKKNFNFKGKTILMTYDSKGLFENAKSYIEKEGGKVLLIGKKDSDDLKIDLASDKNIEESIKDALSVYDEIDGLLLFNPIDYMNKKERFSDKELNACIKSTFLILKHGFDKLNKKDSVVAAPSFNSVVFPYAKDCKKMAPIFAGISGLLKTAAKELPNTIVKVIDFAVNPTEKEKSKIISTFFKEIESAQKQVEVGYDKDKRYVIRLSDNPVSTDKPFVKEGSKILVTGGARGITYEILKKVVKKYKTNIVIMGRSDIYSLDEYLTDEKVGEKEVFAKMKEQMEGAKPVEIKKATARIMRFKESAENIKVLESMGVKVEYNAVDVTNSEQVAKVVDKHKDIAGVLHAAGLEESQFIAKTELSSFNRVFDTKVHGMRNLLSATSERKLDFFLTFSSVTARFGNEGQSSYTAANDMLGKILQSEKQKNAGTVYKTYDWTAWSGTGMATNPTVKKVLEARGLTFLPLEDGVEFFMNDLLDPAVDEVLISGIDHEFDPDGMFPQPGEISNILDLFLDTVDSEKSEKIVFKRQLNLNRDYFLNHHARHEVPIFLGATGIEMMAEAAKYQNKGKKVINKLTEFEIPYGIKILKGKPKELLVEVDGEGRTQIKSLFVNPKGQVMGDPKLHYKGKYSSGESFLKSDKKLPEYKEIPKAEEAADLMYHPERLFMDGVFDSVEKMLSFDGKNLITLLRDSSEDEFFAKTPSPDFELDVVLLDGMFQTGGMVEFASTNNMVLPYRIKEMKVCGKTEKNKKYYCLTERLRETDQTVVFNLTLFDDKKNVIYEVNDYEMVKISKITGDGAIADKFDFMGKDA